MCELIRGPFEHLISHNMVLGYHVFFNTHYFGIPCLLLFLLLRAQ